MIYNIAVSILDADFLMQIIKNLFKEDTLMNTTAEMKIEISNARDCILIEASKLSLKDVFMSHNPKTEAEKKFKETLTEVIKTGIEDFYRPTMDPSFSDEEKTKIHYMVGKKPAVGKSYNWWKKAVKDSKWCFGTKSQYVAFLGVLIKMLVAKGWTVEKAWNAVCNDSKKLGHYWNSNNENHQFEDTGSREICGFFDLANTHKVLAKDEVSAGFWMARAGCFGTPLAYLELSYNYHYYLGNCVAWLVRKKEI